MKKKPARKRKPDPHRSTPLTPQERAILDERLTAQVKAQLTPIDYSAETVHLEQVRDLQKHLEIVQDQNRRSRARIETLERSTWALPKFNYGDHVRIMPLDAVKGRVTGLHFYGVTVTVEYDVRYFHDGKEQRCRVFEDELKVA